MAPALNTHRRPFNTRGRGRGRGRPRIHGRGGSMMGTRSLYGSSGQTNGLEKTATPSRRGRGSKTSNGEKRTSAMTFIRDITAILGDPTAPGYKPREERSYLEFHPDLDVGMALRVMSAEEVDGDNYQLPTVQSVGNDTTSQDITATSQQDAAHTVLPIRTASDIQSAQTPAPEVTSPVPFDADDMVVSDLALPPATPTSRPSRTTTTTNRRGGPGRPPKTPKPPPKIPTEILNLPKPSYRLRPSFSFSSTHSIVNSGALYTGSQLVGSPEGMVGIGAQMLQQHRTTKTMVNIGYQESEYWTRPKHLVRDVGGFYADDLSSSSVIFQGEKRDGAASTGAGESTGGGPGFGAEGERVEYDMDEQDDKWLTTHNSQRRLNEVEPISREMFEITMTKIEKEWCALEKQIPRKPPAPKTPHPGHRNGGEGDEEGAEDSKCAICDDGECENSNAIVFCDGCDLAVHQDCYGVPYIPEGQWLCRKCLNNPNQIVNCIFCPNTDGAFKKTVSNSWAHLLCAIWIPEVVLGNQVYMEPIDGVEKIPKQRWKLTCYICRQKMGACIQCSNKNCFVAFHVTCARRARLFLKMKSSQAGAPSEFNILKGFCDRHVPADWRRENDVENAIIDAQEFYATTIKNSHTADGQRSGTGKASDLYYYDGNDYSYHSGQGEPSGTPTANGVNQGSPSASNTNSRRKKTQSTPSKPVWKLPSGAPVIPQIVFNAVCDSIARFGVRKRKEYVSEACKYWTLKREARRGAGLIKRLQLTESTTELTRRNWKGLSQGRKKLQRRLEFAAKLRIDVEKLRMLSDDVKRREKEKWKIVDMMKEFVDKVYFPEIPLMWPIFEKAQSLDKGDHFRVGFNIIRSRLHDRIYTAIDAFNTDLTTMLQSPPQEPKFAYSFPPELGIAAPSRKPFTAQSLNTTAHEANDVQVQRTANRILRAIAPMIEEAKKKEDELRANPYEVAAKEIEDRFEKEKEKVRVASRTPISPVGVDINTENTEMDVDVEVKDEVPPQKTSSPEPGGKDVETGGDRMDIDPTDLDADPDADGEYEVDDIPLPNPISEAITTNPTILMSSHQETQPSTAEPAASTLHNVTDNSAMKSETAAPIIPPPNPLNALLNSSSSGDSIPTSPSDPKVQPPLPFPIISASQWNDKHPPWYLQEFDPRGLTLHEERWLGRDIARELSPLSELSEDEMLGLVGEDASSSLVPLGPTTSGPFQMIPENLDEANEENGTIIEDTADLEAASKLDNSARGRRGGFRGRYRRGRWRSKGRGRSVSSRSDKLKAEQDESPDEDYKDPESLVEKLVGNDQLRSEAVQSEQENLEETRGGDATEIEEVEHSEGGEASQNRTIPSASDQEHEMDIDTPGLPALTVQSSHEDEASQPPRTPSLSPLTSVIADLSPLSNPLTHLEDQPPMQQSGGMDNDAVNGGGADCEVDVAQQETSTSTPARKSRKNMVFARQSNGRFGSTKAGASTSMPARRKKKKWI
ncbi:hypothetical protein BDZ91DRAFT_716713 [Kalaharituber pfeilii]|nr:hypothetical protein BDZ91DRAFT_716713 [Kalaharituber pfeilii]